MNGISNLRIYFYGVQGSGSVFPSFEERQAAQEMMELQLLKQVFGDLARHTDTEGRLNATIAEIIGGELSPRAIRAYRKKFNVPEARVYGGWTTCIRVETADGYDIVLDCGSGFRVCAKDIVSKWEQGGDRKLYIFGSHSHFDHTEGFDQAAVCFDPRNQIHVYGNRQYLHALDQYLGIFSHHVDVKLMGVQTPISYEVMPAQFYSHEIRDFGINPPSTESDELAGSFHDLAAPILLGDTKIQALELFHPSPCLGYRIERNGKVFIFCTDHELRRGPEPDDPLQMASLKSEADLRALSLNADVLYRDGQFLNVEYDGEKGIGTAQGLPRLDWGHSCIEDVIQMAEECHIKHTYIGHHDPNRDWAERNWIDETLHRRSEQTGLTFELARAETIIDL